MPDAVVLSNYADFLTELMLGRQVVFASEHTLLSELSGVLNDGNGVVSVDEAQRRFTKSMDRTNEVFHGKKLTIPLQLSDIPGVAAIAEGATWPAGAPFDTAQATTNLCDVVGVISVSLDSERDARNGSTSAMDLIAALTESVFTNMARTENDFSHGGGDALLCNVSANTGSGSLVVYVSATTTNWSQLTPGRVVDILTRSNGADPGSGKRRKIASVDKTAGTITFKTGAVASDGGSGNITYGTTEGIYLEGSYGHAPQGLGQFVATTGTVQGIDKAVTAQWKGVDATPSTSVALSDSLLRSAVRSLRGNGVAAPDFGIAEPATVDLYIESKASQVRYTMQEMTVKSGFAGIIFGGAERPFPILKDMAAPRGTCRLVTKKVLQFYGDEVGPGFIDDDGSTWRLFTRAAIKEADVYDRYQLVSKDCGKLATIGNSTTRLAEAA